MTDAVELLLARIRANPEDVAPRREYAALMRAANDPRGDYIATQLALHDLPRSHPDRPALVERLGQLSAAHEDRWLSVIPHGRLHISYKSGFPHHAEGDPEPVRDDLPLALQQAPIVSLTLTADEEEHRPKDPALRDLQGCTALNALRKLTLIDCSMHADSWAGLVSAPVWSNLKEITLGDEMCGPDQVMAMAEVSIPTTVSTLLCEAHTNGGCFDEGAGAVLAAPWIAQLDTLTLNGQSLGDTTLEHLAASSLRARVLGISSAGYGDHEFTAAGIERFARSDTMHTVERLSLIGSPVGEAIPELLIRNRRLRAASFAATGLDGDDLRLAVRAVPFDEWSYLLLDNNPIGDLGMRALGMCQRLPRILSLSNCGITPAGLRELAHSSPLDVLDVQSNPIPAEGWQELLDHDKLPRATSLFADAHDWPGELVAAIRSRYPSGKLIGA